MRPMQIAEKRNEGGGPGKGLSLPWPVRAAAMQTLSKPSPWAARRRSPKGHVLRKEVIQPQVPLRLPCYDFTPIISPTVDSCLPKVSLELSGKTDFRGVTGGVYKARERIHRCNC